TGLIEGVATVPGVADTGISTAIPMGTVNVTLLIDAPDHPGEKAGVVFRAVSPDFFRVMGIPLKLGRAFTARDDASAPGVAVVNEAFARRYWPNENPLGKRFNKGMTVVGVVGDMHSRMLSMPGTPEFYSSYRQFTGPALGAMLVVRTHGDPGLVALAVQRAIQEVYPDQPVSDVATMESRVADSLATPRLYMTLLGAFAGLALLLTAVGTYGVVSYAAGQRTREFGIRIALGARPGDVLRLVMGGGMTLVALGCAAGIGSAWVLRRYVESLLFEVRADDPASFAIGPLVLMAIAAAACYLPARRATRIDPNTALREE
ncbi:MAG: ABC transporter permease, partial [Acidobacteriota bacterium]|nr:ABC transporter permease [Acidobacteriota bacterium]